MQDQPLPPAHLLSLKGFVAKEKSRNRHKYVMKLIRPNRGRAARPLGILLVDDRTVIPEPRNRAARCRVGSVGGRHHAFPYRRSPRTVQAAPARARERADRP